MEYWRYNIKQNIVRISKWVLKYYDEGPWEKGDFDENQFNVLRCKNICGDDLLNYDRMWKNPNDWRDEQKYIVMVVLSKMFETKKIILG